MEPAQVPGDTEDCSGIESGWTRYIVSSTCEDDNYDDDGNNHITNKKGYEDCIKDNNCKYDGGDDDDDDDDDDDHDDDDDESNDSMASDASSGPSHHELPCGSSEGSHLMHGHEKDHSKYSPGKKTYKQVKHERRFKIEEEKSQLKANSAASHVGPSIRKKNFKDKEK